MEQVESYASDLYLNLRGGEVLEMYNDRKEVMWDGWRE